MKKSLFILLFFVLLFSCKNEKKSISIKEEQVVQKLEQKGDLKQDLINNLPFGNYEITQYPFKKNVWLDDFENKKLQKATKFLFKDDYDNFDSLKFEKLKIQAKQGNYFLLYGTELEIEQEIKTNNTAYLISKNNLFSIYFVEVEISDIKNNIFKNQKGGYIITADNKDKIIDNIKFNQILYNDNEKTERWNFANIRISYMDKSKTISIYDFLIKEWDLNYEFKLISEAKYKIDVNGFIEKL